MALTVTNGMTLLSEHDTDVFDEATTTAYTEGQRSGAGYVGYDVDIETLYNFNITDTPPADMSTKHIGVWLRISNAGDVDTKALGGMQIAVRDSSGNESYWYVGGSDTYAGGWVFFVAYCGNTPDANNGTAATLTDIVDLGVGFKMLAKNLDDNAHIDAMYYGDPTITITGTTTTAGSGFQEVFDLIDADASGLIDKQNGVFIGKGRLQFNDNGTDACTFSDEGSTFRWADLPVSTSAYGLSLGSSTGITDITLGSVVGTGDARQGVSGLNMDALGEKYNIDLSTNLGGNASNSVKFYGSSFKGAEAGVLFDDNGKTSVISATFTNCNEVDSGATNNGAEMLNIFIIDPTGNANNYGYKFPQTPSGGTLTHNGKKINFITSGTPTTQYMLNFPYTGDYDLTLEDFIFFGDYSSGTIWHGINSGTNADVTINATEGTNTAAGEYSNTNSGTMTVVAGSVSVKVTTKEADGTPIQSAIVVLKASDGTGDFPFEDVVTITRATTTATVAHTAHGMATGDKILIRDADQQDYNIIASITVTTANEYTYEVANSPTTPATGTITCTFVALDGVTDVNGELSVSRVYGTAQPVTGYTRKSTSAPYFKQGSLNGTISTSAGFDAVSVMTSDD